MLRVTSLLCLLPALALATPPTAEHAPRAPAPAPGALRLQLPERREWAHLAYSEQEGRSSEHPGVLVGVLMGGLLGAGSGIVLCSGLETSDGSAPPRSLTCGFFGGLMGVALGAGIGALIDTAASARRGEWVGPEQGQAEGDSVEFGLQLGWMKELGSEVTTIGIGDQPVQRVELPSLNGPGADLRLLARLGPYVAVGPELAVYELLTREFAVPGTGLLGTRGGTLYLLGLQARGGPALGRLRPELVLGVGRYLGDLGSTTGSAGAALSYALTSRFLPQLEARYHHGFQGGQDYVTVGASAALRW